MRAQAAVPLVLVPLAQVPGQREPEQQVPLVPEQQAPPKQRWAASRECWRSPQ
jgi:hypothetical protein